MIKQTIGLIVLILIILVYLSGYQLPQIVLPKFAQHNTIGELPFVEVMDDGDFYEEDGDENLTANNCSQKIWDKCRKSCGDYLSKNPMCASRCALPKLDLCDRLHEQQLQSAAARGEFTAQWLVFMNGNCGSWACNGDFIEMQKISQEFKEMKNEEWGDKMIWLGNQGRFEKGYMNYNRP